MGKSCLIMQTILIKISFLKSFIDQILMKLALLGNFLGMILIYCKLTWGIWTMILQWVSGDSGNSAYKN